MKTSEILNKAADQIETRGWAVKAYEDEDGCLCPRAGIAVACGLPPDIAGHMELGGYPLDEEQQAAYAESVRAELAFGRHVGALVGIAIPTTSRALIEVWNDTRARTAGEVVREMRACAAAEAEREAGR